MKKFNKIILTGKIALDEGVLEKIKSFSQEPFEIFSSAPRDFEDLYNRITNADAVLCGWNNKITQKLLEKVPHLKYIGMCGTSLGDIDTEAAQKLGIKVTNVPPGYGDPSTAEFIFAQLLNLFRGFNGIFWKGEPADLYEKTIGIIGMGAIGSRVTKLALSFGMRVQYYSRTRKEAIENLGVSYTSLDKLLVSSDVISLHVPRGTQVLSAKEFDLIPSGTCLVNTCLGDVFDEAAFTRWIQNSSNVCIMDNCTPDRFRETFKGLENVIFPNVVAGKTIEARKRLSEVILKNLRNFLR